MKQLLTIDPRVALYGNNQQVEQTQIILLKNIPDLPTMSEPQARLQLQETIDNENVRADVLFDGNGVWSKKKILRDIRTIKKHGMNLKPNMMRNIHTMM